VTKTVTKLERASATGRYWRARSASTKHAARPRYCARKLGAEGVDLHGDARGKRPRGPRAPRTRRRLRVACPGQPLDQRDRFGSEDRAQVDFRLTKTASVTAVWARKRISETSPPKSARVCAELSSSSSRSRATAMRAWKQTSWLRGAFSRAMRSPSSQLRRRERLGSRGSSSYFAALPP
jgi:hypothetical protein